jgi:hypothetical protein
MKDKKYNLKYSWDAVAGNFSKEDIKGEHDGLCDAMMVVSILFPEDGSYSQMIMSADGRTGKELSQDDIFKVWQMIAFTLERNNGLEGWHKEIIKQVCLSIRQIIKAQRDAELISKELLKSMN